MTKNQMIHKLLDLKESEDIRSLLTNSSSKIDADYKLMNLLIEELEKSGMSPPNGEWEEEPLTPTGQFEKELRASKGGLGYPKNEDERVTFQYWFELGWLRNSETSPYHRIISEIKDDIDYRRHEGDKVYELQEEKYYAFKFFLKSIGAKSKNFKTNYFIYYTPFGGIEVYKK